MTTDGTWFGIRFPDIDTPHWLPYLEAEVLGEPVGRKLTEPLPGTPWHSSGEDGAAGEATR